MVQNWLESSKGIATQSAAIPLFLANAIAMQEIARTNQKPKDEWRCFAPPLIFWFLCPKQNLHCYIIQLESRFLAQAW